MQCLVQRPEVEACNDTPHGKLTEEVGELKESIKHLEVKHQESNEALGDLQANKVTRSPFLYPLTDATGRRHQGEEEQPSDRPAEVHEHAKDAAVQYSGHQVLLAIAERLLSEKAGQDAMLALFVSLVTLAACSTSLGPSLLPQPRLVSEFV